MKNLIKKKGKIRLDRTTMRSGVTNGFLKKLYSVFYPVHIEDHLEVSLWDETILFGYSEKFRELEEGEVIPEYALTLFKNKNGTFKITSIEEINQEYLEK